MAKLVVSEFMSLDGVIEEPMWTFPYWSDALGEYKQKELFDSDVLLLGRVTYDGFAEAWPDRTDEAGYADRINSMPKYVVSTTLREGAWNNTTIVSGDIVAAIQALREQDGGDILVFGSGELVRTLVAHDLVDSYRIQLYPLVLGKGQKLFTGEAGAKLTLVETRPLDSGVVILVYEPDRSEPEA